MFNVKLDEQGYFTGSYAKVGRVDGGIDVPTLPENTGNPTCYKWNFEESRWVFDEDKYNLELDVKQLEEIRVQREEAFMTIDKYQMVLYYNDLTDEQKVDLSEYRMAWLDAPETKIIPSKPSWIL